LARHGRYKIVIVVVVKNGNAGCFGGGGDQQVLRRHASVLAQPSEQGLDVPRPLPFFGADGASVKQIQHRALSCERS